MSPLTPTQQALDVIRGCARVSLQTYSNKAKCKETLAPYMMTHHGGHHILGIRGTASLRDWGSNLRMFFHRGGDRHPGFQSGARFLSREFRHPSSRFERWAGGSERIYLTGHSRGGAIALQFALDECHPGGLLANKKVHVITFGEPRGGNENYVRSLTVRKVGHLRIIHGNDIVPRLPGRIWGYRHHGPLWLLQDTNEDLFDDLTDHSMIQYQDDLNHFIEVLDDLAELVSTHD